MTGRSSYFFGDHQPNDTVASVVENGAQAETQKRYLVPYLVWSNYGIEGAKDKNTSLNYLAAQVLTAAGVPTNAYQNYLLSLSKTYPVISAAGQTKGIGADENSFRLTRSFSIISCLKKTRKRMSKNMKKMISRMVSHRSFPYVMAFLMPFIICVVICIGNGGISFRG